ncbi:predicted protein [Scheffersomyces stipitis CBS 6054]|uniref:JmjC domain-containing protein n=1 Tax=Scheffersomyces stipitis (strain ATCC 58785 / CBS 6054 / NBRC 10063 / NRRL Y-11545) TaxID=322104 RepID=A3M052_PICST|nr:predicted protein [Scheffersomyces stipitis CBS 6054]ABN68655.2 predicted protein [Scheffersomyces stipitis CBS 6054]KAG2730915.1 hypothetical protein G9P44_006064 [Scheffersomyces stipitis]
MSPDPNTKYDDQQSKRRKLEQQSYPDVSRNISIYSISSKHPLNVRPAGNSYLTSEDVALKEAKRNSLGHLNMFPEELLMELLTYIDDKETLRNLSHTSRILYAYLYDEEIWKKLFVKSIEDSTQNSPQKWNGSWRCTVLGIDKKHSANIILPDNLVCSDILYRPFQCSQINYEKLFRKIIQEEETYHLDALSDNLKQLPPGRIQRIPESELSLEQFNTEYHDVPFILTNKDKTRWPRWDFPTLLSRFPNVKFRQEAVQWDLALYSEYLKSNLDENPLYLFDCSSEAMTTLRKEYDSPSIFKEDLFTLFNLNNGQSNCRPDHAWLIVGPERSGSTFHKDPNYTSAWNAALKGRKLWVMLPPGITPPGVGTDEEESEVTSPVGIAEWVISGFFNDSLKIKECLVGITFPGECMYVPSGWWHSVINLDDSVALTQNFVPFSKLTNAMNFLKNRRDQISGFRPYPVKESIDYAVETLLKGKNNEDIEKMREYSEKFNSLNLGEKLINEDCGEISELPPMPVYELFKQLLILNGKEDELATALEELKKLESRNRAKTSGRSEAWEKLTTPALEEQQGFSFGFNLDESSDEE